MTNYNIYYGEYTLDAWIKMILNRSLELPPYQRDFVWTEEKVIDLLNSLKKGNFVPPITIGTYLDDNDIPHHYVLDGQQRLSAILLGKIGVFPKGNKFSEKLENFANNNDDVNDDRSNEKNVYAWKFSYIQNEGIEKTKQDKENYKDINVNFDENYWKENCIGFSYIKPQPNQSKEGQKKYFSTLFRNINSKSVSLSDAESRASLYWLDSNWFEFFKPTGTIGNIKINNGSLDFARIVAILAQYKETKNTNCIAQGYSRRSRYSNKDFEDFIEDFIYETVGEKKHCTFIDLNKLYPNKKEDYLPLFSKLSETYADIGFDAKFESIILSDLVLFGLVYYILFDKKEINISKKEELRKQIQEKFEKVSSAHKKSPAAFTWLRERLRISLEIYGKFLA